MPIRTRDFPRRVQLDLPSSSYERLIALKTNMEASSYADVMKASLRLLEYLIKVELEGGSFMVKDAQGNVTTLKVFT